MYITKATASMSDVKRDPGDVVLIGQSSYFQSSGWLWGLHGFGSASLCDNGERRW